MNPACEARVRVEEGSVVRAEGLGADVPWWSFTKTVIAAAALGLVRDGRLTLDEPVAGRAFTLRQLLQHRAGVTNYGSLPDYHAAVSRHEDAWPVDELLARTEADRLVYPPGEGWAYSNIGYLFVGRLLEQATGETLGTALARLVLEPLGIGRARLAARRADLAGVEMGEAQSYDPHWVYHVLLVGPLQDAALLLHRLMTRDLLPPVLMAAMLHGHPVGAALPGRPWITPALGLGLMTGGVVGGRTVAGHTGGGPGSVIAVYHVLSSRPARTVAAFSLGEDADAIELSCLEET